MDTYEKKYKEALERAKKLQETCDSTAVVGWCEYIFPELKESEDERIRKELVAFLEELSKLGKNTNFDRWKTSDCANWIAWLEKQGEILVNSAKTCKDEQKPVKWDEYDEMYVAALITMVKNHCTTDDKLKNELIGWLVSLKTIIKQ